MQNTIEENHLTHLCSSEKKCISKIGGDRMIEMHKYIPLNESDTTFVQVDPETFLDVRLEERDIVFSACRKSILYIMC